MPRFVLGIGAVVFLLVSGLLSGCSQCGRQAPAPQERQSVPEKAAPDAKQTGPAHPIRGPVVDKIVEEILVRNQAVQSYTCAWDTTETSRAGGTGPARELIQHEERNFKRPQFFRAKVTQEKGPLPGTDGQVYELIADGMTFWKYVPKPSSAGAKFAAAIRKNVSQEERAAMIRKSESPRVFRQDIGKLREAGAWEEKLWPATENLLLPFSMCETKTLFLESDNPDTWVFCARPVRELKADYSLIRVTIAKADGILRERECTLAKSRGKKVQRVGNLVLNPELADGTFTFTPPEGVEVVDQTGDEIKTPDQGAS